MCEWHREVAWMSTILIYSLLHCWIVILLIQPSIVLHLIQQKVSSWLMNLTQYFARSNPKTKYFAKHAHRLFFLITRLRLPRPDMTVQSKYVVCLSDTQTGWNLLPLKGWEIWHMNLPAPNVRRLKFSKQGFLSWLGMSSTLLNLTLKTNCALFRAFGSFRTHFIQYCTFKIAYRALFRANGSSQNHIFYQEKSMKAYYYYPYSFHHSIPYMNL